MQNKMNHGSFIFLGDTRADVAGLLYELTGQEELGEHLVHFHLADQLLDFAK
jgi:hypothetical protein